MHDTLIKGTLSKKEFKHTEETLRRQLTSLQQEQLRGSNTSLYIVIAGMDGSGKGLVINTLAKWLDPRGVESHSYHRSSDEEEERPYYWRFWRTMPAHGRIGVHFGSWYERPLVQCLHNDGKPAMFERAMDNIARHEHMLSQNGTMIVKFWLHLSRKEQYKRLQQVQKHPHRHWRFARVDWNDIEQYDNFSTMAQKTIDYTDREHAPWYVIDAQDTEFCLATIGETLVAEMKSRLLPPRSSPVKKQEHVPKEPPTVPLTIPSHQPFSDEDYSTLKEKYEAHLHHLTWKAYEKRVSSVLVFEGWDAAGKGGTIRRLTGAIDAQLYKVIPIAAPTDEEKRNHYLWRFWRHIPRDGESTIFDRSWYGRVLVERVEGFASEPEWQRAYDEINNFEQQLAEHGIVVVKFWLHISAEEQLRRFQERENTPYKTYKITDEDWRNRSKRSAYDDAIRDMITRTHTPYAQWHIVESDDKRFARVDSMRHYCTMLEKALRLKK